MRECIPALRARFGWDEQELPDNATSDEITAALRSAPLGGTRRRPPRVGSDRERPALLTLSDEEREGVLLRAVQDGKFSADRAPHWRRQLIDNTAGTLQVIAMLESAPNPAPGEVLAGQQGREAYPPHWLGPNGTGADGELINPPVAPGQEVHAATASDVASPGGYTNSPAVDPDDPYPPHWIGGRPEIESGPIGFEDPGMRAVNGKGYGADVANEQRRRGTV